MAMILERPIPLPEGVYLGASNAAMPEGVSDRLFDVYQTSLKTWRKRPGKELFCDLGVTRPIQGLYAWRAQGVVVAVCNGQIYHIDRTGVATDVTGDALGTVQRVSFPLEAEAGDLPMANGGKIVIDDGSTTTAIADADAPTTVDSVDWLDTYLLAQKADSRTWQYSAVGDDTAWDALDFENAQTTPDLLLALRVAWREVFLFGQRSLEVWYNDGVNPWVRNDQAFVQTGLMARDGLAFFDSPVEAFVWMDDKRNIRRLDRGRGLRTVSAPIARALDSLTEVNDVKATPLIVGNYAFCIFNFPGANRTFVYELNREQWTEWGAWNSGTGSWDRFPVDSACYMPEWNTVFVGDSSTGKIYTLDFSTLNDDGAVIRSVVRTGPLTHGTYNRKTDHGLIWRVARGQGSGSNEPTMQMRYRDENGVWSNEIDISLGSIGEDDPLVNAENLGQYRMRQYELIHADTTSEFEVAAAHVFVEGAVKQPGESEARW